MNRKALFFVSILFFSLLALQVSGQKGFKSLYDSSGVKIVFYNCENLYDTIDDPSVNDSDFLPSSDKQWTSVRYNSKITNLARVLYSVDSNKLPAIIGLCEIENHTVLNDLVASKRLKKGKYKIIHCESSDPRGIDVALLYRPDIFRVLYSHDVPVSYEEGARDAREFLYVKGVLGKSDTLHIFVNHWKSRMGGTKETEPKRIRYAQILKSMTDSLFAINESANILIMGDFNDSPTDKSLFEHLQAMPIDSDIQTRCLYNLLFDEALAGQGSHYYKDWEMFDQIIASSMLIWPKSGSATINPKSAAVFSQPWMLFSKSNGVMAPSRTFDGKRWCAGYSDHLPVVVSVRIEK